MLNNAETYNHVDFLFAWLCFFLHCPQFQTKGREGTNEVKAGPQYIRVHFCPSSRKSRSQSPKNSAHPGFGNTILYAIGYITCSWIEVISGSTQALVQSLEIIFKGGRKDDTVGLRKRNFVTDSGTHKTVKLPQNLGAPALAHHW